MSKSRISALERRVSALENRTLAVEIEALRAILRTFLPDEHVDAAVTAFVELVTGKEPADEV